LLAGAVNDTVAVVDPVAVAVPIVGAPGTVVLDLPCPVFISTEPEAWPKRVLTTEHPNDI
jgi:hypothetical protein